jgi:hypothetical protein
VPVVIRQRNADTVLVEGALEAGDMVVTEGRADPAARRRGRGGERAAATPDETAEAATSSDI